MFKAIIFDLDGTLIDSAQDVRHALNKLLIAHKCQEIEYDHIYGYLKHGICWLIKTAFLQSKKKLDDNVIDELIKEYLFNYQAEPIARTTIYPGVIETLSLLKKQEIKFGICTNKPSIMTNIVLEKLQLISFFDAVVAADDTAHLKPHPAHIYDTLIKLDIKSGSDVVMVGDSDNDIIAAKNARIPVIAAKYGYSVAAITRLEPDLSIDDFYSLPSALKNIYHSIYEKQIHNE
ncbi:MAG TPA: HAD-IA family hydrolase [Gammaproteobacteria bacterium]|nr:HAD-IA family hydrolase [Gammaproteobacteria bacterium]